MAEDRNRGDYVKQVLYHVVFAANDILSPAAMREHVVADRASM